MKEIKRLVCVSNRLPIVLQQDDDQWTVKPSSGGLVAALEPILRNMGGVWVGWPGAGEDEKLYSALAQAAHRRGYQLQPVFLSAAEEHGFYHGFSNEILWPLFHGLPTRCNFDPDYWHTYESANQKFAETTLSYVNEDDFLFIQDYHLMLVASYMRRAGHAGTMAFFLHIPFPAPENFLKLPWRAQLLEGLLSHDLVGFQTLSDRDNFLLCLRKLRLPGLRVESRGAGTVIRVTWQGRELRVGAFPISIDYDSLQSLITGEVAVQASESLRSQFDGRQILIGMDRLDYTKGIPERLEAFRLALQRYPDLRKKVSLVQVVVPSREAVPEYEKLLATIERLVGRINGEFTVPGEWVPIHYIHRSLPREEAMGYLLAGDIALVTPLRDGMNLVAKEFCAAHIEERGVLILSEFAGAAAELKRGAILVNPHDVEGMAEAIYHAVQLPEKERRKRMRRLRDQVRQNNIYDWVSAMLGAALVSSLDQIPLLEEYVPTLDLRTWTQQVLNASARASEAKGFPGTGSE